MDQPGQLLVTALAPFLPDDVNLNGTMPDSTIMSPALVIRPGEPWSDSQDTDRSYCVDAEQYTAVVVTSAGSASGAQEKARKVWRAVIHNLPPNWKYLSVGGIVLDQDKESIKYLAAPIRLKYLNPYTPEEEETDS